MAVTINASTSAGLVQTADTSGVLQLQTNSGTTALTIDTSQNVGIGTTSPTNYAGTGKVLQVNNSSSISEIRLTNSSTGSGAGANGTVLQQNGNDLYIYNGANSFMAFGTNNAERMRIDSSGNVGVGTTPKGWGSPIAGTVIQVGSAAFAANGIIGYCLGNAYYDGTNWKRIASGYGSRLDVSADNGRVTTNTAGTSTADSTITWTAGPYVANLGTSWTNSSDERLKNITGEITDAINKVSQLRAAKFTWKADELNTPQVGLIAQDLQKVLPEVVVVSDKEFDGTAETALGVNYDNVIPLLVAAIKEQQTIINDLKARIETLEGAK